MGDAVSKNLPQQLLGFEMKLNHPAIYDAMKIAKAPKGEKSNAVKNAFLNPGGWNSFDIKRAPAAGVTPAAPSWDKAALRQMYSSVK